MRDDDVGGGMGEGGEATVRDRMEALGWRLGACEDTCAAQWMKVAPDGRVEGYENDGKWSRDLASCQRAYGYDEGRSYYG